MTGASASWVKMVWSSFQKPQAVVMVITVPGAGIAVRSLNTQKMPLR